jgi:RimJ/RimL family protein N-acetyltransferase
MTATVTLRPVELADLDVFYEHQADTGAAEMAAFPSRERGAHFEHWTKRVLVNPTGIARTILVDGTVSGNVVSWIDASGRRLLGYWIGHEFWGRGIATEALRLFLADLPDRPLYADVATSNVGSQRVLRKNGFVPTGQSEIVGDEVELLLFILN